tara:strand:+ start:914 stop:1864 length:951 start_codon:yes stop_codon:yes gene_type:complete
MADFTEQLLTYTHNYSSELSDIELNKRYKINNIKQCYIDNYGSNLQINPEKMTDETTREFHLTVKWVPKQGETHIEINKDITFIDYLVVINSNGGNVKSTYILDNYGNKHKCCCDHNLNISVNSNILTQKDGEILSDQVIDYIKDNGLICILNSEQIKQIQKLADLGKEKTIKYVMECPQTIIEIDYDRNNIIRDLIIAFPGCDPWKKSIELFYEYSDIVCVLEDEYEKNTKLLEYCICQKNNIQKLIKRNKDIDDEDIKELIEIKRSKLENIESQIEGILESNSVKREKLNKYNILLCKLDLENFPEKNLTTEFM